MQIKVLASLLVLCLVISCSVKPSEVIEQKQRIRNIVESEYRIDQLKDSVSETIERLKVKKVYKGIGDIILEYKYEYDGSISEVTYYKTIKDGVISSYIMDDGNGKRKRRMISEYDDFWDIKLQKTWHKNMVVPFVEEFTYDDDDNIIAIHSSYMGQEKKLVETRKYNVENQLIELTDFNTDGSINDVSMFLYDENGYEIEKRTTSPVENYSSTINDYDDFGNVIITKITDHKGVKYEPWIFKYKYDLNNNWILKQKFLKGNLVSFWEREIEYRSVNSAN